MYVKVSMTRKNIINQFIDDKFVKENTLNVVRRYGLRNYLNWIYDLGLDLKDDMHLKCEHDYERLWVKGKIKSENTDGILVIIRVTTPQQHTYSQ